MRMFPVATVIRQQQQVNQTKMMMRAVVHHHHHGVVSSSSAATRRRFSSRSSRMISSSSSSLFSSSSSLLTCSNNNFLTATNHHQGTSLLPPKKLSSVSFGGVADHQILSSSSSMNQRRRWKSSSSVAAAVESDDDDVEATEDHDDDFSWQRRKGMRCIAIIAHVDHGKTSLVDCLLRSATTTEKDHNNNNNAVTDDTTVDRLLDSGDLEKERGITITSKVTRVNHLVENNSNNSVIINIADTPGHADFSAEVDRILSVADGFLLVVDIVEGIQSQTKYVLSRALALGLHPVVVWNKCDRPEASGILDNSEREMQLLDLFLSLDANDDQLEYTSLYASAKQGWITDDPINAIELSTTTTGSGSGSEDNHMSKLLDIIVDEIPEPKVRLYDDLVTSSDSDDDELKALSAKAFENDKFSLAAVSVGYDQFLGRTCSGRITSGSIGIGDKVVVLSRSMLDDDDDDDNGSEGRNTTNKVSEESNVSGVFVYKGTQRVAYQDENTDLDGSSNNPSRASAGDYITITGVPNSIAVGDTVTSATNPIPQPIRTLPLAPPTLSMDFGANDGPLAGKDGSSTYLASSQVRDRLVDETDNNVTLKVEHHPTNSDKTVVYARGELQLGILVEEMRREGYEMVIAPPKIVTKTCSETQKTLEPYEEVIIDVDSEYTGGVVNLLTSGERKGILLEMTTTTHDQHQTSTANGGEGGGGGGKSRLVFEMPSRGMLGGFRSELATATRGTAVVNHIYIGDREQIGPDTSLEQKGKLVSTDIGKASAYALASLEARGTLFIAPGDEVYSGMVIGENAKSGDLEVNPIRAKQASNMRTQAKDDKIQLSTPKRMSVEELIAYMSPDEMIEVTPQHIRLRKQLLDAGERERASRTKTKQLRALKDKK